RWRPGSLTKKALPRPAPPGAEMRIDELRFQQRFGGYSRDELPLLRGPQPPEFNEPLPPLDDDAALQAEPAGLGGTSFNEHHASILRMRQLNFRAVESHPELTLTFRSKNATLRGLS